jgi:sugar phosphate permease
MSYRWELLLWLWLAFFFNQADRQVFNVVLPLIGADLRFSSVQLGLINSVFVAANGLMVPVAGFLGDVFSRKRIVVISLFAWSLTTLCTGFGSTLLYFLAVRGLATAVGEAFYFPSAIAMLAAEHMESRARAFSIFQTSVYTGLIASGWLGGAIAEQFGWRSVFWMFGGTGVMLAMLLSVRLRNRRSQPARERIAVAETVRAVVSSPSARLIALATGAMIFVNIAYLTWTPAYLYERFHLTLARAGLTSMLFHHAFAFAGVLAGGVISDRLAPARPRSRMEIQGVALLAGVPFIFLLGQAGNEWTAYVALSGFGLMRGLFESNVYAAFYCVIPPRYHSAASGLLIAFSFVIASAAPVVLGRLKETAGLASAFSSLSALYALGGAVCLWGAWRYFASDCFVTAGRVVLAADERR